MLKKTQYVVLALLLVLGLAQTAAAALNAVGPINPANGYPQWYQDTTGLVMELPVPPLGTAINDPDPTPIVPTMVFDMPIVGNAFSQQIGFGAEAMYWTSAAVFPAGPFNIQWEGALEAAFASATGNAQNGQQIVFSRIRIRIGNLVAGTEGTWTVRHPYGTDTLQVTADDFPRFSMTRDIGGGPLDFATALTGDVGPFLRQTAPIAQANVPPGYPLTNWIGDGATVSTVTGAPGGFNQVTVTPPPTVDIGAGAGQPVTTFNFVTSGRRGPAQVNAPGRVSRVSFTRSAARLRLAVFGTGAPTGSAAIFLSPAQGFNLFKDAVGNYFRAIDLPDPALVLPPTVTVRFTNPGNTHTNLLVPPVDYVQVTLADYHISTRVLTVKAISGEQVTPPILTLVGFGTMTVDPLVPGGYTLTTTVPAVPSTLTVSSSLGGEDTAQVNLLPIR